MSVADFPTWDGKGEDNPDDLLLCERCGRPMRDDEAPLEWACIDDAMVCPECWQAAEADGLVQAERQGE